MWRRTAVFCARAALFLPLVAGSANAVEVRTGVLAFRGSERAVQSWGATLDYLSATIPEHTFRLVPLNLAALGAAVANGEVDFVLTNPGHYVELEAAFGISRIATVEPLTSNDPRHSIGSAIVVRGDDRRLQGLGDLAGSTLQAVDPNAFGGYQAAWHALRGAGLEPGREVTMRFVGFPMDRIAHAVAAGKADAGILRACLLEQLERDGQIAPGRLRVLAPRPHPGFSCATSTRLYPDWPLAKTRDTPRQLAKQVAVALYAMPEGHPAARRARYAGWTIPVDYQPVHELFRSLAIGPYARPPDLSLGTLLARYWQWLAALLVAALWMVWHVVRVEQQVRTRTAQLSAANLRLRRAMQEQAAAEERARQHEAELAHAARVDTAGELAAGLAHEINQPLAAIGNYAEGSLVRLRGQGAAPDVIEAIRQIGEQAARAGAIVHRLRAFLRKEAGRPRAMDLNAAIVDALSLFAAEARRRHLAVKTELEPELPPVWGEPIQVEQVVINLLRNAAEAMEAVPGEASRQVVISTRRDAAGVVTRVADSGPGLSEEARRHLFEPFYTTKPQGMGLGLSISRSLIESAGGTLAVSEARGGGAVVEFALPAVQEEDPNE